MNNKEAALNELYDVLVKKYGNDPATAQLIQENISSLKQKLKITVFDLDSLENSIKVIKKQTSSVSPSRLSYNSPQHIRHTPNPPLKSEIER